MVVNLDKLNLVFIWKAKNISSRCKFVYEHKKESQRQVLFLDSMIMENNLVNK